MIPETGACAQAEAKWLNESSGLRITILRHLPRGGNPLPQISGWAEGLADEPLVIGFSTMVALSLVPQIVPANCEAVIVPSAAPAVSSRDAGSSVRLALGRLGAGERRHPRGAPASRTPSPGSRSGCHSGRRCGAGAERGRETRFSEWARAAVLPGLPDSSAVRGEDPSLSSWNATAAERRPRW